MKPNMYLKIKKKSDCVISLLALALLSPILIIIMLVIKLSSLHAPVFFKQKRVGEDGHLFYMYKFRTMHVDAEAQLNYYLKQNEIEGAMFKLRNDPRVTKFGRILRKTSLDELPQLWNVIKGNMALVGPRPPLPREVAEYTTHDKKRLSIIPGCTGLWQVSGRNELSFQEMVELDLQYIQQVSFKLDAKIIGKTVLVILMPKGAY
ncbi:sugar transferase [Paenilisteria rocourtiae]|uniref:Lipopolysaccharide/colanic/teichoic acid biosynthesis glycosyltransferase n=1 Tax=Listeria rocourtiae TaxID=647910 RepID=A0A4R6ZJM8_9LIST|nr:sugar transferase [Listeria rocourtiae]TDR52571.1 lipopolysaccharide/colanic/teichoic acid biosynthesis glycosyltransferase [Listeria rocourtiae]